MKLLIYTDNHFSQYSSILRRRGEKYSVRLENQIKSLNWVQKIARERNCNAIYCLGDFFDQNALNAEELTALKDIKWSNIPNTFLVGNHELGNADATFTSVHLLKLIPSCLIINQPALFDCGDANILCLPYLTNRKDLKAYTNTLAKDKKLIIFSHNEIKGIQYGPYKSTEGFSIDEISTECSLFINGHIHNFSKFCHNGLNLGNLTGQNFSEDAESYTHNIAILDTSTLQVELIENPYALNFYKLDFTQFSKLQTNAKLASLKHNAVITVKVLDKHINTVKEQLSQHTNILESRVLLQPTEAAESSCISELVTIDHREQFKQYVLEKLGASDVVITELTKICEA